MHQDLYLLGVHNLSDKFSSLYLFIKYHYFWGLNFIFYPFLNGGRGDREVERGAKFLKMFVFN